jgi:HlyD family secretion protein
MQLKEARDLLGKASIYSPIDGTVVRVNAEEGDRVVGTGQFEGTQILRVANLDSMEVRIDVSEADIIHVEVGQIASVEVDAIPNEKFSGRVSEIAHSAETTDQRSQEQLTTFSVKVKLDDPNPRIRPGMTATAEIETATVEDAITVPLLSVIVRPAREINEALGEAETRPERSSESRSGNNNSPARNRSPGGSRPEQTRIVFVVKDNVAHMRKVETGIADRNRIEIKSGLSEGETVITGSYRALTRELSHLSEITVETSSGSNPWER